MVGAYAINHAYDVPESGADPPMHILMVCLTQWISYRSGMNREIMSVKGSKGSFDGS